MKVKIIWSEDAGDENNFNCRYEKKFRRSIISKNNRKKN